MQKGDSSLSINSVDRMCSLSDSLSKEGTSSAKRTSVVFEEPKGSSRGSNSLILAQNRQVSTSKTVNGILRKGSLREEEEKARESVSSVRKSRKSAERSKGERHSSKSRSHKTDSTLASSEDTGDSDKRSSRSRSNSTKSSKADKKENLALTRDLPWCGCWGNGCL